MSIAKGVGNKDAEGCLYSNLGHAYHSLADFKRAIEYHQLHLRISKELIDRAGEGTAYGNLGNAYWSQGDFKKALECHELHLDIAKEVGDRAREGRIYSDLGNAYKSLGDFETAMKYHKQHLNFVQELGDRAGEAQAYTNLSTVYFRKGDFKKSIYYQELQLSMVNEDGDITRKQTAYNNLGIAYFKLGDIKKAIEYLQLALCIAKEVKDRVREGRAYNNLGIVYCKLGDFNAAKEYCQLALRISKEVGNKASEGEAYANLGVVSGHVGDFQKAFEYHQLALSVAKTVGDVAAEGRAYDNLGIVYRYRSDYKKAIEYHNLHLDIARRLCDKAGEGDAYNNLGIAFQSLGDFQEAIKYFKRCVDNAKLVQDRAKEGRAYGNLGNAYSKMRRYDKAIEYLHDNLEIVKEVGDKAEEGGAYCNLGVAYKSLGKFTEAIMNHQLHLSIAKQVGDKAGEGYAYTNIGNVHSLLGDHRKALEYYNLALRMNKEVGDKVGQGICYLNEGYAYVSLGNFCRAETCLKSSVGLFDHTRSLLSSNDEWKISIRNQYQEAYTQLWMVLLRQNKIEEALFTAERGRAQTLMDLMESRYSLRSSHTDSGVQIQQIADVSSYISPPTVFLAVGDNATINFWVFQDDKCNFRYKKIDKKYFKEDAMVSLVSLNEYAYSKLGVLNSVQCENRSFDDPTDESLPHQMLHNKERTGDDEEDPLKLLYDLLISPIADVIHGDDVTIVPDGPLFLTPYAALMDQDSRYLSEKFTLRMIPTLATLKIMAELSERHQGTSGALLVGDPWLGSIRIKGKVPEQLQNAKKEVKMIGKILKTVPLTDKAATKAEVLSRLSSVALVHIAAHGKAETGEILLSPNPTTYKRPKEKDYLLKMEDVKNAKLNAQLVVLSCCHSGRGDINAEGVVGIARAFLGAGARSVLASLWAIDDAATLTFMEYFYKQLVEEKQRTSKSLNQAMRLMRESKNFSEERLWAPFVLIGDDISLDVGQNS